MVNLKKLNRAKKILFVNHLLAMGDAVLLSPIFKTVKENLPNASVSVLTHSYAVDFVKAIPYVDEIVEIESVMKPSNYKYHLLNKATLILKLASFFRSQQYDFIVLRNDRRISHTRKLHAAGRLSGAEIIPINKYMEKHVIKSRHIVETYYNILEDLGLSVSEKGRLYLRLSADAKKYGSDFIENHGFKKGEHKIVGICPTSNLKVKNWNFQNVGSLCLDLEKKAKVIIFSSDKNAGNEISKFTGESPIHVGLLKFNHLLGLLSLCDVFVGVDTGPTHMAAALGVPTIGLYGPTSGTISGPYGKKCVSIQADFDCPVYNPIATYSPSETLQNCYINDRCSCLAENCVNVINLQDVIKHVECLLYPDSCDRNELKG